MPFNVEYTALHSLHNNALFGTFLISRSKITYLLVSCRSSNKPRLVQDREVLHRILESTTLLITIGITVILQLLLLTRGDTIIVVWGFIFKVKLRRERQPAQLFVPPKHEKTD